MNKTYESLFLQGNFKKIVALHEADVKKIPDPFFFGSLVFIGRIDDAEVYLEKWSSHFSTDQTLFIYFFLAIGFIRSSQFKKGRSYLGRCFSLRHQLAKKESKIFLFQAFGFHGYFICRYRKSAYWAQKTWRLSLLTDSDLGQILSCDLLAHALLEIGDIEKGFEQLQKASKLALQFGQGALVTSLEVSKLCYQAFIGIKSQTIVATLQKKFSEMKITKDTYSKTNLGLELARQYYLRGRTTKAEQILQEIKTDVFKFGHRRQKSLWHFRFAFIEFTKGQKQNALSRLVVALNALDQNYDLFHKLQILGLKYRLEPSENLLSEIGPLSFRVGSAIALKHYYRLIGEIKPPTEDILGNLIDETKNSYVSTLETTQKICEQGYYQLLRNYKMTPQKNHIFLAVLPQALLIFSEGTVEFFTKAMTPLLQRVLLLLYAGPRTKKDLIEEIWGYQYDPLRHDQLVHAVLARLRKNMGKYGVWIHHENDFVSLNETVNVNVFQHTKILTDISQNQNQAVLPGYNLNYRQIKILSHLRNGEPLSVRDCMNLSKSTKITTNRDLKDLLNWKLLNRTGNGKATRYH